MVEIAKFVSYPPLARDWAVGYSPILDQYAVDLATLLICIILKTSSIVKRNYGN